jgi:SAM-dependent methyltransferase
MSRFESILRTPRTLYWRIHNPLYGRMTRHSDSMYCIKPGYRHRNQEHFYDDTANTDNWQKEVYQYAVRVMNSQTLSTVYDIGCGSGYKLVTYLGQFETIGFDLSKTVEFLRITYPERTWFEIDVCGQGMPRSDLVVCADVIEHVLDPDYLLGRIVEVANKYIILSTPDRDLLYSASSRYFYGPPENPSHVREWTFIEFARYISKIFNILDHRISNQRQATQMMLLTRK